MKTETLTIGGMTCINCQNRIEQKLNATAGIETARVSYADGTAAITYDEACISRKEIAAIIETLDYKVISGGQKDPAMQTLGYLAVILALYMIVRQFSNGSLAAATSAFPLAEAGMGYGMLFVIGLITSLHCVAMCGGINLSQCIPAAAHIADTSGSGNHVSRENSGNGGNHASRENSGGRDGWSRGDAPHGNSHRLKILLPSILYNGGRVISYTLIGVIVGALGSVITVTGAMQGVVQLAAGAFMVIMGINMLGIFPGLRRFNLHLPKIFARKIDDAKAANRSPLVIGLLNGLMPCGPLQAMQLYALSTGSPIAGGVSMFLFSMGTVPLMFGIGALSSTLSKQFTARVMKAGAVLVAALGLTMFANGYSLSGLPSVNDMAANNPFRPAGFNQAANGPQNNSFGGGFAPVIENGVQIINSTLSGGRYPAITVQQGIPVKWNINAPAGSINGCNNRMIIREYGIEYRFKNGENIVEFTPQKSGRFSYSCWMGMIRSSITVVAEGENAASAADETAPKPAGVEIPTNAIALAEIVDGTQTVTLNLTDDGFAPAIAVMQKNIKTKWVINNNSLDEGNRALVFPIYYTRLGIENGENTIGLVPTEDFEFSTIDNVFYGYVKVVDDINAVDSNAIKKEVAEHETLIYPDAYFDAVSAGGGAGAGCCGRSGGNT